MTSIQIEKSLEYLKIQESLRSEISQNIIYLMKYFYVFLYPERYYASTK